MIDETFEFVPVSADQQESSSVRRVHTERVTVFVVTGESRDPTRKQGFQTLESAMVVDNEETIGGLSALLWSDPSLIMLDGKHNLWTLPMVDQKFGDPQCSKLPAPAECHPSETTMIFVSADGSRLGLVNRAHGCCLCVFSRTSQDAWELLSKETFDLEHSVLAAHLTWQSLLLGHENGNISLWDLVGPGERTCVWKRRVAFPSTLCMSANGRRYAVVSGCAANGSSTVLIRAFSSRAKDIYVASNHFYTKLALSENGHWMVGAGKDTSTGLTAVEIWNLRWQIPKITFYCNLQGVPDGPLCVSNDGCLIAATMFTPAPPHWRSCLINTMTKACLDDHQSKVVAVFSDIDNMALTTSSSGTVFTLLK